ncbi:MAG: hypothetical protein EOR33_28055 [Mesorhizobium sp.]|nr:MAG: hypothetical protein EOR33_28055 [Mesorhizobium sp.]
MAERQVDILIVDQHEHIAYFADYKTTAAMYQAVIIPLEPVAVIRALDAPMFSEASWLNDYVAFGDSENPIDIVAKTIIGRGHGGSSIGVDSMSDLGLGDPPHSAEPSVAPVGSHIVKNG